MREIKFRGKRIDNGEWVYGYYVLKAITNIYNKVEWLHVIYVSYKEGFTEEHKVDPETVGQFIGQKDKSEQEIYEGDLLAYYDVDGELLPQTVKWVNTPYTAFFDFGVAPASRLSEVIGNIYENPELISGKELVKNLDHAENVK